MKINIDDLDIFIINKIYNSDTTTWEIVKDYYKSETTPQTNKKHSNIKKRLKKMENWGIIIITKNGSNKNQYNLIEENVAFKRHKFLDGNYKTMALKINNNWCSFQLS